MKNKKTGKVIKIFFSWKVSELTNPTDANSNLLLKNNTKTAPNISNRNTCNSSIRRIICT